MINILYTPEYKLTPTKACTTDLLLGQTERLTITDNLDSWQSLAFRILTEVQLSWDGIFGLCFSTVSEP